MQKETLFLLVTTLLRVECSELKEVFGWNQVDFQYPSESAKQFSVKSGEFKQEHNLPLGLEVWNNKVFITVPRWKSGVPSSLNYVSLTDGKSPALKPYPSWEMNNITGSINASKIANTFRVRADECDRLWVIDSGIVSIIESPQVISPPKLLIFNLTNDQLIRTFTLKKSDIKEGSFFANIVIDVQPDKCEEAYAYLPDLGSSSLIVYSLKENDTWRIAHHYFHFDPLSGNYNVGGVNFQWTDGVFGIALSPVNEDGFRTMYFHPLSSTREFSVSTRIIQNKTIASDNYHAYKVLGSRGPDSQATASFLDEKSGVIFYTQVNKNGVGCWNSYRFPTEYSADTNDLVVSNNETMVFPNDLKIDRHSNLWVLTDRLPQFIYKELNKEQVNFRVLMAPVSEIIKGTICEGKKN